MYGMHPVCKEIFRTNGGVVHIATITTLVSGSHYGIKHHAPQVCRLPCQGCTVQQG